jgi:hypothetical protein
MHNTTSVTDHDMGIGTLHYIETSKPSSSGNFPELFTAADIRIDEALMNTSTDDQKQEFVDGCTQKVFGISQVANAVCPL